MIERLVFRAGACPDQRFGQGPQLGADRDDGCKEGFRCGGQRYEPVPGIYIAKRGGGLNSDHISAELIKYRAQMGVGQHQCAGSRLKGETVAADGPDHPTRLVLLVDHHHVLDPRPHQL